MQNIKKKSLIWIVLLLVIVALFIYANFVRNKSIRLEENVKNQWGNLQGSYQRRLDLVPQLVSVVKGVSDYEKNTLTQVATARAQIGNLNISGTPNVSDFEKQEVAQSNLVKATNTAIAVIEKYPDLQGTKNYLLLQEQLVGTERRISFSRNDFSNAVKDYNIFIRNFPNSLMAKLFGFSPKEGFKADEGTQNAPQISFSK